MFTLHGEDYMFVDDIPEAVVLDTYEWLGLTVVNVGVPCTGGSYHVFSQVLLETGGGTFINLFTQPIVKGSNDRDLYDSFDAASAASVEALQNIVEGLDRAEADIDAEKVTEAEALSSIVTGLVLLSDQIDQKREERKLDADPEMQAIEQLLERILADAPEMQALNQFKRLQADLDD